MELIAKRKEGRGKYCYPEIEEQVSSEDIILW